MADIQKQSFLIRTFLVILIILQIVLVATVYPISAFQGYLAYPKIYLSNAFGQDPTRPIASFILPISAFIIALVVSHRLYCLHALLKTSRDRRLWRFLVAATAICCLGLLGVAAVSVSVLQILHWIVSALFFLAAIAIIILFTAIDDSMKLDRPNWLRTLRIFFCVSSVISGILFSLSAKVSPLASGIGEILVSMLAVAYLTTFAHSSSFPIQCVKPLLSPRQPDRGIS